MLQLAAAVVVHGSSTTELFEGRPVLAWKLWCAWLHDQAPGENAGGRGYFCMSEKKIPRGFNQKCSNWKGSISQQSLAAGPYAGAWCVSHCSQLVAAHGRALPLRLGAWLLGLQAQRARVQVMHVAAGSSSDVCLLVNRICLVSLGFFFPRNKLFSPSFLVYLLPGDLVGFPVMLHVGLRLKSLNGKGVSC